MTSPRGQEDRRTTSRPVSLETGALELNQFVLLGKQVIEGLEVFCKSAGSCTRGYSFWVSEYRTNKWIQIMKREYLNLYSNPDGSWTTPLLPTSCAPTWGVRRRRAREVFTNSNTARSSTYLSRVLTPLYITMTTHYSALWRSNTIHAHSSNEGFAESDLNHDAQCSNPCCGERHAIRCLLFDVNWWKLSKW